MKIRMTEKMINCYLKYLQDQEKSRRTIEKYKRDVYKLYHFLEPGRSSTEIP